MNSKEHKIPNPLKCLHTLIGWCADSVPSHNFLTRFLNNGLYKCISLCIYGCVHTHMLCLECRCKCDWIYYWCTWVCVSLVREFELFLYKNLIISHNILLTLNRAIETKQRPCEELISKLTVYEFLGKKVCCNLLNINAYYYTSKIAILAT